MTTLAANVARRIDLKGRVLNPPVIASDIIWGGAAVGDNGSGYARPLVAGDPFLGFANEKVDNSLGAAGDKAVEVWADGYAWLSVSGISGVGNALLPVYASDDDTFTATRSGNSYIGQAVYYDTATGLALVRFKANSPQSAIADAVVAHDANPTFSDTEIEGFLDALGTKINAIIDALELAGIIVPS